jgi:prepilin-type N-terminal cleavage/methylation domain-containing protein
MRLPGRRRARGSRGFTLLELGIVLGVSAILAVVVMPDFVESQRNKMAERTGEDVSGLFDAARWYWLDRATSSSGGVWPGQQSNINCTAYYDQPRAKRDLFDNGYVTTDPNDQYATGFSNVWFHKYEFDTYQKDTNTPCMLRISTNVPTVIAKAFIAFLPQARCKNPPGGLGLPQGDCDTGFAPQGFVRCCGMIPPPGAATYVTGAAVCGSGKRLSVPVGGGAVTCVP